FDLSLKSGEEIEIEFRDSREVHGWGDACWACNDSPALNPAFDVTPSKLITAIITERGVIERPSVERIRENLT
ncbi:MAG TPA: S-methyl-5-thioribose-1-phosphate isomerase, partial [candidate division Zixibacteria bacterium]|nr:S-methyl-5-thioribose-1-phosphate isomerase [candidate division Zixibacteria bacterium]